MGKHGLSIAAGTVTCLGLLAVPGLGPAASFRLPPPHATSGVSTAAAPAAHARPAGDENHVSPPDVAGGAQAVVAAAPQAPRRLRRWLDRSYALPEIAVALAGDVQLVMVRIPAGSFTMGAPTSERSSYSWERPAHAVQITHDFYLGKYEVTQAQWQAVVGTAMPTSCGTFGVAPEKPVYCVSWNDVGGPGGFIERLNELQGTTKFRLPTEAEWEYAARSKTTTRFSHGNVLECDDLCEGCAAHDRSMWWCGSSGGADYGPQPVGQRLPNGFGLYDMHGNEWEWVHDFQWSYPAEPQTDPQGPESGFNHMARGGSWGSFARAGRSAYRTDFDPATRFNDVGFRLAMSP